MFCPNCGAPLGEQDKFCKACGTPSGAQAQAQAPVQEYAQPAPVQEYAQPAAPAIPLSQWSSRWFSPLPLFRRSPRKVLSMLVLLRDFFPAFCYFLSTGSFS